MVSHFFLFNFNKCGGGGVGGGRRIKGLPPCPAGGTAGVVGVVGALASLSGGRGGEAAVAAAARRGICTTGRYRSSMTSCTRSPPPNRLCRPNRCCHRHCCRPSRLCRLRLLLLPLLLQNPAPQPPSSPTSIPIHLGSTPPVYAIGDPACVCMCVFVQAINPLLAITTYCAQRICMRGGDLACVCTIVLLREG